MRGFIWFKAALIVAAGLLVYAPALHGAFLWDDPQYVTANPLLRDPAGLWKAWFAPGSVMEFYPLQETVLWLQWRAWGAEPFGYHLTNVLLHVASALLLWRFFTQLGLRHGWLGGLIFLLHPANVESVAWISELKNTLSLPPFLVAMTALVRFDDSGRRRDYTIALAAFTLAMLVKISMAPFPFVILLYAWWKRGRIGARDVRMATPFLAVAVMLAALTVFAYLRFDAAHPDHPLAPEIGGPVSRLALAETTVAFYFAHTFCPLVSMPMYPQGPAEPPSWRVAVWWGVMVFGLLPWLWVRRVDFGRHVILGLGFFLLMIAPFSGLATQSYMYFTWVMDHFLYIAMIGPIGLVVAGVDAAARRVSMPGRVAGGWAAALLVLTFGLQSRAYAAAWTSGEKLWKYATRHNPGAWLAYYNLGNAYRHEGAVDRAIPCYQVSIQLHPHFDWSHNNLGICLAESPDRLPEAIEQYREAIQIRPAFAEAHNNLANALTQTGQADEAIPEYQAALDAQPGLFAARYNLALALLRQGRKPEAAAQLEEIIRQQPGFTAARVLLEAAK